MSTEEEIDAAVMEDQLMEAFRTPSLGCATVAELKLDAIVAEVADQPMEVPAPPQTFEEFPIHRPPPRPVLLVLPRVGTVRVCLGDRTFHVESKVAALLGQFLGCSVTLDGKPFSAGMVQADAGQVRT